MKIKEWYWRNFASYGNIDNKIEFLDDKGELILLMASNGGGKTSLGRALDFSFFGECLNDRGKKLTQKLIPNRDNGNMSCGVRFYSKNNELCEINRYLSGSLKFELSIDKVPYTKAGKIQDRIHELTGYDFDTYKSFISLNMNIFKDFINLTPEDKRKILDKLFNLQLINELNKVLKQLRQQNDTQYTSISREVKIYEDQIDMLKKSIEAASNIVVVNNEESIKQIKASIKEHKTTYTELSETRGKLKDKLNDIDNAIDELKTKKAEINRDVKEIQKQIDLFDCGKCPTCGTDLSVQLDLKGDLVIRKNTTLEILAELEESIELGSSKYKKTEIKYYDADAKYTELTELLMSYKAKISVLEDEQSSNVESNQIGIFKENLTKTNDKFEEKKEEFIEIQKMKYVYDTLSPIWGENGIKRDILENIIGPINQFVQEDLSIVGSRFTVELDSNFDVHIFEWGSEIDSDTLSTGEAKKINLIVMLAYIKMNRLKNSINLLILDELFSGIDVESVDFILHLMKKYANERGINIIVVHHSELNKALFDRVISVKKAHFSVLEDERISNI